MRDRPNGVGLLWDLWRAGRVSPAGLRRRQRTRLAALIVHARRCAPYYRQLYHDLPPGRAPSARCLVLVCRTGIRV